MLYSEKFPSFPENVSIKINKKTNVLYFLHGCAYANFGDRREYRIYYKDNTHKSITLIPTGNVATGQGENIQDWFFSPVIEGPDVKYVPVPVKENPTEITDLRFIYILEWKNPYPEKEIDSIELISGKGQTIIFVLEKKENF